VTRTKTGSGRQKSTQRRFENGTHSGSYAGRLWPISPWRAATAEAHSIGSAWCSQCPTPWPAQVGRSSGSRQGQLTPNKTISAGATGNQASEELTGQELHARLRGNPPRLGLAPCIATCAPCSNAAWCAGAHLPSGEKQLFRSPERVSHQSHLRRCGPAGGAAELPDARGPPEVPAPAGWLQLLFHTLEFFRALRRLSERQKLGLSPRPRLKPKTRLSPDPSSKPVS